MSDDCARSLSAVQGGAGGGGAAGRLRFLPLLCWLLLGTLSAPAALAAPNVAGWPPDEALRRGEQLYREGLLPSGKPLRGTVQDDIPVSGKMFSCQSCHLRSGLGSLEGEVLTLPTHAAALFAPVTAAPPPAAGAVAPPVSGGRHGPLRRTATAGNAPPSPVARPAYSDETLAYAIRNGVDSAGRELAAVMPRYQLDEQEMALLLFYLKHLSAQHSPGVTNTTLHLATVVSSDLPARQREALLATLQAHVAARNGLERPEQRGGRVNMYAAWEASPDYRRTQLHVWEVRGEQAGWEAQLEKFSRETPVFALLGGLVTGGWGPIHAFCERNRIPSLFPLTDQPVLSDNDWYTLYFSRGHRQEGEAVARHLRPRREGDSVPRILQLFRDDPAGRALAEGFAASWAGFGLPAPEHRLLPPGPLTEATRELLRRDAAGATVLLWLGPEALPLLEEWTAAPPAAVFLAAGQFDGRLPAVSDAARPFTWLTWPWRWPHEAKRINQGVLEWLRLHQVPVLDLAVQSRVHYLAGQLYGALMEMQGNYYRDYLLDQFDMLNDQLTASATYPRLSFGPGQRYAAKGCYIVQLSAGPAPQLLFRSEWQAP